MKLKLKHKFAISMLSLLSKTWRISLIGDLPHQPAVFAFWHGEMLPIWKIFGDRSDFTNYAVVSLSKDGEILSCLLEKWGFELLRGSSSRNGKDTIEQAVQFAKDSNIFITPDGPRGPRFKFKAGAAVITQRASSRLFAVRADIKSKKVFKKSWDKFILPMPFAKIDVILAHLGTIPADYSRQQVSELIEHYENSLNSLIIGG